MTRIRRGGYIFMTWKGDHPPRHVHVYNDDELVLKWNLEENCVLRGDAPRALRDLIAQLQKEGAL